MSKWIHFDQPTTSPSGKTQIWRVRTAQIPEGGHLLGTVAWYSSWRKYAFFPAVGCVFEDTCLRDLAHFCQERSRERREAR